MKKILAFLISRVPSNVARVGLYRLLGYKIAWGAQIGLGTVICIRSATIGRARIRTANQFHGPFDLIMADGARIGADNEIHCVRSAKSGRLEMAQGSSFSSKHVIDASGGITIGAYTRVAGRRSQFWTHGGQRERTDIVIGERCYIGSACLFSQGVTIGDNCFIGLGSVITASFPDPDCLIAGSPARIVKRPITARLSLKSKSLNQDAQVSPLANQEDDDD